VFYFENGGDPEVFIGSADWMDRNLVRRVEVVFPVEQADLKARLIDEVLAISLADNVKAREMQPDGTYRRVQPAPGEAAVRSQQRFLELAADAERRLVALQGAEPVMPAEANGPPGPKVTKRTPRPKRPS
jgi:polyphosphate kinase